MSVARDETRDPRILNGSSCVYDCVQWNVPEGGHVDATCRHTHTCRGPRCGRGVAYTASSTVAHTAMAAAVDEAIGGPLAALPSLKQMFPGAGVGYLARALRENNYVADTVVMKMLDETDPTTSDGQPSPCRAALAREESDARAGSERVRQHLGARVAADNEDVDAAASHEYADMTLICQGEKFPAHRVVLAARSQLLRETLLTSEPGQPFVMELDESVSVRGLRTALILM